MGMLPELENRFPEGEDLTIMNTYYSYPQFEDNRKICDDYLFMVYKDNSTGKKGYKVISKPDYTFYRIKDDEQVPNYNQLFISRDKVVPVTVPYSKLEESIAILENKEEIYKQNLRNRNRMANRAFHTEPDIFFSDVNIEDHYRFKFAQTYKNNINKLYKGFFDIEVDSKWAKGDFVEMGECEINCVSYYDDKTHTVYVYILRNPDNPLIDKFEQEINTGLFGWSDFYNFMIDTIGGMKQAKKFGLVDTQFSINFYDAEIDLIRELFANMHRCSPDFIEGWNSSAFDLEYIIQRVINLGYDPVDILCDQSWPVKVIKNYVDTRHINELAERGDYTFISGCPVFIDQMIQYASRRKAKFGSFKSFKLDDIGELEAGVKKLDYHHITSNIAELPWLDFKTFVLYNIIDVIVQKCIEARTNDLEYIFAKCVLNNTAYKKGHRQTVYLVNRMASEWFKMGYVIGNNCNKENPKGNKFLGALVGDPDNTDDYAKMKIDGRSILVCENLNDYD